jgi:Putative MetA-pathway of phenol degradation
MSTSYKTKLSSSRRILGICLCALLTAFSALSSQAALADGGPPMVTDDPGTPGDGRFEINLATLVNRSANATSYELPLVDINYGVGERLQLKVETPYAMLKDANGRATGLGNTLVGVKWRFWDSGEEGFKLSTYPQVQLNSVAPSSKTKGLADPGTNVLLPLQFQKGFGDWDITADLGRWQRVAELDSTWLAGVVLGHKLHANDQIMFEVHTERADGTHHAETLVNLGTHLEINPHVTLLLSLGRDISNTLTPFSQFFCYAGLQIHIATKSP